MVAYLLFPPPLPRPAAAEAARGPGRQKRNSRISFTTTARFWIGSSRGISSSVLRCSL